MSTAAAAVSSTIPQSERRSVPDVLTSVSYDMLMDGDVMAVGAATNNDRYNIDIGSIGLWYYTWNLQPTTTKSIFLLLLTNQYKGVSPGTTSIIHAGSGVQRFIIERLFVLAMLCLLPNSCLGEVHLVANWWLIRCANTAILLSCC